MGDSWDDEDVVIPQFTKPVAVPLAWDEEEDLVDLSENTKAAPLTPAMIEAAEKKAKDAELALEAKMKLAILSNETPAERKAREKKQVEDSDNALAGELFDTGTKIASSEKNLGSAKGLGSISLKTKQDHQTLGTAISQKLLDSSTFNIAAFYKTLSKALEAPGVTSETLEDIIADINKIREGKVKAVKQVTVKKSKKEIKADVKKHADVFGGSDYVDKYNDQYGGMEDDFM